MSQFEGKFIKSYFLIYNSYLHFNMSQFEGTKKVYYWTDYKYLHFNMSQFEGENEKRY